MRLQTHFAESDTLELSRAILIYESPNAAVATQHNVLFVGKTRTPTVGAGVPLSKETIGEVARKMQGVGEKRNRQLLSDNVLISDDELLLWWLPSARHLADAPAGRASTRRSGRR